MVSPEKYRVHCIAQSGRMSYFLDVRFPNSLRGGHGLVFGSNDVRPSRSPRSIPGRSDQMPRMPVCPCLESGIRTRSFHRNLEVFL